MFHSIVALTCLIGPAVFEADSPRSLSGAKERGGISIFCTVKW